MTPQLLDELSGSKGKLIVATIDLMASRGYESTSVQDILEAAQVTKSNFYYHFKSKEELCLAALEVMQERFFKERMEPVLLNPEVSPKNRFLMMMDFITAKMEAEHCCQGCPFSNLAAETSDFYPEFQKSLARFHERKTRIIEQCYAEGVEKGEFRSDIPSAQIAGLIHSTLSGSMNLAKTYKNINILKHSMTALFQLISKP